VSYRVTFTVSWFHVVSSCSATVEIMVWNVENEATAVQRATDRLRAAFSCNIDAVACRFIEEGQ
jgi:hypothetical protein